MYSTYNNSYTLSTHVRLISQCKYFHKSNGSLSSYSTKVSMCTLHSASRCVSLWICIFRINFWRDEYTNCFHTKIDFDVKAIPLYVFVSDSHHRLQSVTNPWLCIQCVTIILIVQARWNLRIFRTIVYDIHENLNLKKHQFIVQDTQYNISEIFQFN